MIAKAQKYYSHKIHLSAALDEILKKKESKMTALKLDLTTLELITHGKDLHRADDAELFFFYSEAISDTDLLNGDMTELYLFAQRF